MVIIRSRIGLIFIGSLFCILGVRFGPFIFSDFYIPENDSYLYLKFIPFLIFLYVVLCFWCYQITYIFVASLSSKKRILASIFLAMIIGYTYMFVSKVMMDNHLKSSGITRYARVIKKNQHPGTKFYLYEFKDAISTKFGRIEPGSTFYYRISLGEEIEVLQSKKHPKVYADAK